MVVSLLLLNFNGNFVVGVWVLFVFCLVLCFLLFLFFCPFAYILSAAVLRHWVLFERDFLSSLLVFEKRHGLFYRWVCKKCQLWEIF